jgi:membrane-associated protease RseP (regulator of RpoE activity)
MKRISLRLSGFLALFCSLLVFQATAQNNSEAIIIQKITNEDGSITTVKKRVPQGEDIKTYAKEFNSEDGNVEIHIVSEEEGWNAEMDGETVFLFRKAKKEMEAAKEELKAAQKELESVRVIMHENQDFDFDFNFDFDENSWQHHGDHTPRTRTEKAKKAFVGIYPGNTEDGVGVKVTGVVNGAGAQAAGIQKGDVIKQLNGMSTNGTYGLRGTLKKIQPNSTATAVVVRNGQEMQVQIELGEREYTRHVWNEERDPCEVFIGVYVGGRASIGEGVQVTGIIGNTAASRSGVESGDVILAMDGISVNDNGELLTERDKHDAGDAFVLTIQRGSKQMDINARFNSCDEEPELEIIEEVIEEPQANQPQPVEPIELDDNALQLDGYRAFPNPTFGQIRVQYTAEPVPTVMQISDATGRVVYQNRMNNFNGTFDEQINLIDATPGTLTLTIRQGAKVQSKQIVLLNRA